MSEWDAGRYLIVGCGLLVVAGAIVATGAEDWLIVAVLVGLAGVANLGIGVVARGVEVALRDRDVAQTTAAGRVGDPDAQ